MSTTAKLKLESHFIPVKKSRMHYYDVGSGDPILFLHGMPVSAYVWRNIIPKLSSQARCIAPDLIGMGQSDKPNIRYTISDHIAYLDAFIDALKLKNITLVLHGWGSVIGFDYARRHPKNIKAIAFYESHIRPVTHWNELSLPVQQFASLLLNQPSVSRRAVIDQNYLIEKMLQRSVLRRLTAEEMQHYRAPFSTPESRKPLWQYMSEFPLGVNASAESSRLIKAYSDFLQKTTIPKLLLYAVPGFMMTMESVIWAREHLPNLELVSLENALYLAQETIPDQFTKALQKWVKKL